MTSRSPLCSATSDSFLVRHRSEGRRPLLVIDKAQKMSLPALEEVRLLSNLETEESKLLQILVAGHPKLRDAIADPDLEHFRQRVAVSYHLTALDEPDIAAYVNTACNTPHRVRPRFPPAAAELVHSRRGAVPRIISDGAAKELERLNRRLAELAAREDAIAQRERQIAQRRVLAANLSALRPRSRAAIVRNWTLRRA